MSLVVYFAGTGDERLRELKNMEFCHQINKVLESNISPDGCHGNKRPPKSLVGTSEKVLWELGSISSVFLEKQQLVAIVLFDEPNGITGYLPAWMNAWMDARIDKS